MRIGYAVVAALAISLATACRPEPPVTSTITIDAEMAAVPVNADLYGIALEEINHAIEGGLHAELIRNRNFDDGVVVPPDCRYDASDGTLVAPSGWRVPFADRAVIAGWRPLNEQSFLTLDSRMPLNESNPIALYVETAANGGVVAEGFEGIAIRKGEAYDLSCWFRGSEFAGTVTVELRDSMGYRSLSNPLRLSANGEWQQLQATLTATDDAAAASLVFEADAPMAFRLDMVSLMPHKRWSEGRAGGLRTDLAEAVAALRPRFVRYPGGASAAGYAQSALPHWEPSVGHPALRRSRWSIWGYGTSGLFGYGEFLQLCEALRAYPVYTVNAGLLDQRYRTVSADDDQLKSLLHQAYSAIAYATQPIDSVYGRMRAADSHSDAYPMPTVELGYRNYGLPYERRYRYLRRSLKDSFPHLPLISADTLGFIDDRVALPCCADPDFLAAGYNLFDLKTFTVHTPIYFVGEFGAGWSDQGGTMRAAVGEAAFLIGAERNPANVKAIAYTPLMGHVGFPYYGAPAILFDASRVVGSPSYHVLRMFAENRGDELVQTTIDTHRKPLITLGRASVVLHDFYADARSISFNGRPAIGGFVRDGRMELIRHGAPELPTVAALPVADEAEETAAERRTPDADDALPILPGNMSRRHIIFGDSTAYNGTLAAQVRLSSPESRIELRLRDNGLPAERGNHIAAIVEHNRIGIYACSGTIKRRLAAVPLAVEMDRWYTVELTARDERLSCSVDGHMMIDTTVCSIPSLIAITTRERATGTLIIKIVNTTQHDEWAQLRIRGIQSGGTAEVIELTGHRDARNTLDHPDAVAPKRRRLKLPFLRTSIKHCFPPNSVTVIRLKE